MIGYVKYVLLPYTGNKLILPVINNEVKLFETGISIKKEKDLKLNDMFNAIIATHIIPSMVRFNPELLLSAVDGNLTTKYVAFDCDYARIMHVFKDIDVAYIGTIDGLCNALNVDESATIVDVAKVVINDTYVGY